VQRDDRAGELVQSSGGLVCHVQGRRHLLIPLALRRWVGRRGGAPRGAGGDDDDDDEEEEEEEDDDDDDDDDEDDDDDDDVQVELGGVTATTLFGGILNATENFFEGPRGGGIMGLSFGNRSLCSRNYTCFNPMFDDLVSALFEFEFSNPYSNF
jgi:hypothetical protein